MSFITVSLLALLISISVFGARIEAKPLNQINQVKFRRLPPKEFTAALGSSITIECEAGGSPPPTIHWLKNGKRIQQNDVDENQLDDGQIVDDINRIALSSTRSRLFIDCANFQDEAVYTCVAENAFSRISSHTKLSLIRPVAAVGLGTGSNDNDLLAGTLEEVAAMELATGSEIKELTNGESELPVEKTSLSAVPFCLSQRSTTEPVRIHMWTHNIVETMKNNIILYCRSNARRQQSAAAAISSSIQQQTSQQQQQSISTSNTDLSYNKLNGKQATPTDNAPVAALDGDDDTQRAYVTWSLPDSKLVDSDAKDKYEVLETGDLLIKDLRWADMGSYVCTVSDDQSQDSVSTFVYPASVKLNGKKASLTNRMADFR